MSNSEKFIRSWNVYTFSENAVIPDDADFVRILAAGLTLTLPNASSRGPEKSLLCKDESGAVGQKTSTRVTVDAAGSDTVEGADGVRILDAYGICELYSNGVDTYFITRS